MAGNAKLSSITPIGGSSITVNGRVVGTKGVLPGEFTTKEFVEGKTYTSGMTLTLEDRIYSPDTNAKIVCVVKVAGTAASTGNAVTDFASDIAAGNLEIISKGIFTTSHTYTVGTGGVFSTLTKAINYLSNFKPVKDQIATLQLVSGFALAEQIFVQGWDAGWITITSIDATVTISRLALTTLFGSTEYGITTYPAFGTGMGGTSPLIATVFNMDATGTATNRDGYILAGAGTHGKIKSACGFTGAANDNIACYSVAGLSAKSCVATSAGRYGILSNTVSTVNAESATTSGTTFGIAVLGGGVINAASATGTLSKTANTVTAAGIIYQ